MACCAVVHTAWGSQAALRSNAAPLSASSSTKVKLSAAAPSTVTSTGAVYWLYVSPNTSVRPWGWLSW